MNTIFLLMAQYKCSAIIPIETVCQDYFRHLTPEKLKAKIASGSINLALIRMENSQKSARGIHINDLADYIDAQIKKAKIEQEKLTRS